MSGREFYKEDDWVPEVTFSESGNRTVHRSVILKWSVDT